MTDNDPKISFIVPAYNGADTIEESVESIFNGNFEAGDEVIIVNDCSPDDTEKKILSLKKKYPQQIVYLKNNANKGCPATRNVGISAAKNPLIFNLDQDNILVPGSIKKLKKNLLDEKADVSAFSEFHYFKKNVKEITHKWIYDKKILTLADFLSGHINPGPGGNFLYTKKSWEKIGGYWEYGRGSHEAWGFSLKQLANDAKFVVLPHSYYFHRYGHDSLFVTEARKDGEGSRISTKMLMNFIHLITEKDAEYIKNNPSWFDNLSQRPLRLKTGEVGTTGYKVNLDRRNTVIAFLKKNTLAQKLRSIYKQIRGRRKFLKQYEIFRRMSESDRGFIINAENQKMILGEDTERTKFDAHYIYHPAWAARIVKKVNPEFHTDISSTLTFSSLLSAFIPVKFYDYRPAHLTLSHLTSDKADLQKLPFEDNSIRSLSCMHTVEHIGLGRYGDPIDPDGDLKAISELKRVLSNNGDLLFVVPLGKPQIRFNAHRIYSYAQIMDYFSDLKLEEFSLIPDNAETAGMITDATKELADKQTYGCGCFWFKKP